MTEKSHWDDDLLGRKDDAQFLYNFLIGEFEKRQQQGRTASYVLNVDSDWGNGKSFFLDRFAKDLESKGHLVARVNAWQDDHADDPYIAIMAAIDKTFKPYVKEVTLAGKLWAAAKQNGGKIAFKAVAAVGKGLVKKHLNFSTDDVAGAIDDLPVDIADELQDALTDGAKAATAEVGKIFDAAMEAMIGSFSRTDQAMVTFREKLAASIAAAPKEAPLFVLVDELDRCRPTYAVRLLERVKHLFDVDGVIFVFGTNTSQLKHSVAAAYGIGFDGSMYLNKFFDRTYTFDEPDYLSFIQALVAELPADKINAPHGKLLEAIASGCRAFRFDLRSSKQVIELIDAAATAWSLRFKTDICLLFPICAHFFRTRKPEWPNNSIAEIHAWKMRLDTGNSAGGHQLNMGGIYLEAQRIKENTSLVLEYMSQPATSDEQRYTQSIFREEWDVGFGIPHRPSIHANLLPIIAHLGKFGGKKF